MGTTSIRDMGITIEISGICNARCVYCARHRFNNRFSGSFMSHDLFEKIVDHLIKLGLSQGKDSPVIDLYNWGEPLIHPQINEILQTLKKKELRAGISSNFIVTPEILENNLPVLGSVKLSLSGFSQDSYGKIHGASLDKVLENFEDFYKKICDYSPDTIIRICWHRYRFNEDEMWKANEYFNRPGIFFEQIIANFNDLYELFTYIEENLPEDRLTRSKQDLFLDYISEGLDYYKNKTKKEHHCFQWDSLVIDEYGQLLLCCGMTNNETDHVVGHILDLSADEIRGRKLSDPICKKCIRYGIPQAFGPQGMITKKPLPECKKWDHATLMFKIYLTNFISPVINGMRNISGGEKIISLLRNLRDGKSRKNRRVSK